MADRSNPEEIQDCALDAVQGGEMVIDLRRQVGQADLVHVNAGGGWDHTLTPPETKTGART